MGYVSRRYPLHPVMLMDSGGDKQQNVHEGCNDD
jgi:hypothetical protein